MSKNESVISSQPKMLHSPEPWQKGHLSSTCRENDILDAKGAHVVYSDEDSGDLSQEDADRIVACVNTLAGIPTCDPPKVRALWDRYKDGGVACSSTNTEFVTIN